MTVTDARYCIHPHPDTINGGLKRCRICRAIEGVDGDWRKHVAGRGIVNLSAIRRKLNLEPPRTVGNGDTP